MERRAKTRLVPPAREAAIRRFEWMWLAGLTVLGGLWFWSHRATAWSLVLGFVLVMTVWFAAIWLLTRGLEPVDAAPVETRADIRARMVVAHGKRFYRLGVGVSLFGVAAALWLARMGSATFNLVAAAVFALLAGAHAWQLRHWPGSRAEG